MFAVTASRLTGGHQRRPPKEATSRTRLLAHRHHHHIATMGGALRPEVATAPHEASGAARHPAQPLGAAGGYRPHRVNHAHIQHAHTAATYALRRDQRAAGQRAAAEAAVETPAAIHTEPFTLALARMAAALPPGTCDGGASAAATHSILLRNPPPWAAQGLSCMLLARCCATSCTSW